jgi:hypothetical protein
MSFVNRDGTVPRMADMRHYFESNYDFIASFGYYELISGSYATWGKSNQAEVKQ